MNLEFITQTLELLKENKVFAKSMTNHNTFNTYIYKLYQPTNEKTNVSYGDNNIVYDIGMIKIFFAKDIIVSVTINISTLKGLDKKETESKSVSLYPTSISFELKAIPYESNVEEVLNKLSKYITGINIKKTKLDIKKKTM